MRSCVRKVGVAGSILAFVLTSTALPAQTSRQSDEYDPYNPYRTTQRDDTAADRRSETAAGTDAADTQVSASSDRFRPDEVRQNERASERRDPVQDQRPVQRRPVPRGEFEIYVSEVVDKPLRRFGASLLVPEARDFTTPATATVPTDYRLNPGDQLVIGLTGSIEGADLRLTIDSNGKIFIPRIGDVQVGGVRYGDVQSVIARQVSRQYRDFRVSVAIGELRGLTVYVTGFAATPGAYTVSSLSTLVNAVLAAGGPSAGGSFRSIQLRRGGRLISDFDLYDLLLKGDKSRDSLLQNGDVIYIAPAGPQVAMIGSVNAEAIYEAREGETLNDILLYAGGVNTVADDTRLLVLDPVRADIDGWEQITPAEVRARIARRAQIVRVLSGIGIARPTARQPVLVTVSGEVAKPGRYYFQPGVTVAQALAEAGGLTPQAYPFATVFTRETVKTQQKQSYDRALRDVRYLLTAQPLVSARANEQLQPARQQAIASVVEQLEDRAPQGRVVLNIDPRAPALPGNFVLENNDSIYIPPPPVTVGVFGSVPSPGSFQIVPRARLRDYLRQAGGVQEIGDKGEIFVVRANGSLLASKGGLFSGSALNARALPGDLIFVPIDANRGEFWARLRDITAVLFQGAVTGATIAAVSN